MSSKSRVIYTGMTHELVDRVRQHKQGEIEGFTKKYNVNRLVYFEGHQYVDNCIAREKEVKGWTRAKRVALIESMNPTWEDLAEDWFNPDWTLNLTSRSLARFFRTAWTNKQPKELGEVNKKQIPRG